MSGSRHWKLSTVQERDSCWFCDNWIYTLYFWNESIGCHLEKELGQAGLSKKAQTIKQVSEHHTDVYEDNQDLPVLFTASNSWQPQPMMKLLDFVDTLSPANPPDFDFLALNDAQNKFEFGDLKDV